MVLYFKFWVVGLWSRVLLAVLLPRAFPRPFQAKDH